MKTTLRPFIITILLFLSFIIYAQKDENYVVVNMNTKFILELETTDSLHYQFKLKSQKPFNKKIKWDKPTKYLDGDLKNNQIQGVLGKGKFGDNINTILMIKNGHDNTLSYKIKIKLPYKSEPISTSVIDLFPHVLATELWPYEIEYIIFLEFTKVDDY
ncbi:MAG: hypothetical protein WBL11_05110 [Bacteroidales bacterium]|nr:hypothetical protein [Bacteroidales bacterium]MDI9575314.1 hypothetical protein [Bacteroidota bacterium]MDD2593533.1 hypothetical protein [Bacteroidales bacterium]MDD3755333.1 hypothetical protein [Bacteroidales bacterium]MDY0400592.1 hypothetical protein [Bacteroidales bacterium]